MNIFIKLEVVKYPKLYKVLIIEEKIVFKGVSYNIWYYKKENLHINQNIKRT